MAMSIENQAEVVVALETMFKVRRVERPRSLAHDIMMHIVHKPSGVNAKIKAWYGSDWIFNEEDAKEGELYIVNYGSYWLEGSEIQIRAAYIYTAILGMRIKIHSDAEHKENDIKIVKG